MQDGTPKPFRTMPPKVTNTIPRADSVIQSNRPVGPNYAPKPPEPTQSDPATDAAFEKLKQAHIEYCKAHGKLMPLPADKDLVVNGVVIPKEVLRRIGRYSIEVPPMPEHFLKPGERW